MDSPDIQTTADETGGLPTRRAILFSALFLVLLAFTAYHNSFHGPFIYDDLGSISQNPAIRSLWPLPLSLPPEMGGETAAGRPLVNLSLAVNYALGGLGVFGYHVFNFSVHLAAGLVLFGLLRRTFLLPALKEGYGQYALPIALAASALWLVHPLQTESVTYIVQRAESLASLFYLLTLYSACRGFSASGGALWLPLSVAASCLGMASKEIAVTAPVAVFLYDWLLVTGSFGETLKKRPVYYAFLASSLGVLALLMLGNPGRYGTAGFGAGIGPWEYLATQLWAVPRYIRLFFWPHPLVLDYGDFIATGPGETAAGALLAVAAAAAFLRGFRKNRPLAFAVAAFFLILAPTSSFVPIKPTVAEHRTYLALAVLCALVAAGAWRFLAANVPEEKKRGLIALALTLSAVAALTAATVSRNADYSSAYSIWSDTAAKWPGNPRALENMLAAEKLERVSAAFEERLSRSPGSPDLHFEYGMELYHLGLTDLAAGEFRLAASFRPGFARAEHMLGTSLSELGKLEEGAARLEEAIRLDPELANAHYNLGNIFLAMKKPREALLGYSTALTLRPVFPEAQNNAGCAFLLLGDRERALAHFRTALARNPALAEARENLSTGSGIPAPNLP